MNDKVFQVDNREDINKGGNHGYCDSLILPFFLGPDHMSWSEENPFMWIVSHTPVPTTIIEVHKRQSRRQGNPKSNRKHRPGYPMYKSLIHHSLQVRAKRFISSDPFRDSEFISEGCEEEFDEGKARVDSEKDDVTENIFK